MMEEHPMAEHARTFKHREETGYAPDDVYVPGAEDFLDSDHHEITNLVVEQYAHDNMERRESALRDRVTELESVLRENGIESPE